MKTRHTTSIIAALTLALPLSALCQSQGKQTPVTDSGSASAAARQAGSTSGSNNSTSAGVVMRDGRYYVVRDTTAVPLDQGVLRPGYMMTSDGKIMEIPEGMAGLRRFSSNVAGSSGSSSATARQSGATSGSATSANTQDGWIYQDNVLYRVKNGEPERAVIPDGQMMTWRGERVIAPSGLSFETRAATPDREERAGERREAREERASEKREKRD